MSKSQVYTKLCSSGFKGQFIKNHFAPCPSFNDRQEFHGCYVTEDSDRFIFIESKVLTHSDGEEVRIYFLKEIKIELELILSPDEIAADKRSNKSLRQLKKDMIKAIPNLINKY